MRESITLPRVLLAALLVTLMASFLSAAEERQRSERPQRGQRSEAGIRRGGGFDRTAMRQRMMKRMQEQMGIPEKEWAIIEPRLSKVMELSQSAYERGMMFRRMRGGRRTPDIENAEGPIEKAAQSLQETLENETVSTDEIKSKLRVLRSAREKAQQELAKAQQDLREVLTIKQEAQLVMMGMLD